MYLFKSKNGKISAKVSPSVSTPYNHELSQAENFKAFYGAERNKLKKYGFEPCTWEQSLSEFIGTDKQLFDFIACKVIDGLDDCFITASIDIWNYLISVADEMFNGLFTDTKLLNLAFLHRKAGNNQKANEYNAQAVKLFDEECERLMTYRNKRYAEQFYRKYIDGAESYVDIACKLNDYMLKEFKGVAETKQRFKGVFDALGLERQAKIVERI